MKTTIFNYMHILTCLSHILLFAGLYLFLSLPLAHAAPCQLTVGVVPQFEQRKIINVWNPILAMLSEKTGCVFELKGTQTILEFERQFKHGAYDMAYMNPYHAVMANDAQGYLPMVRSGAKQLKGILTVHKDSGISDVGQLQGETIAFPSPNALGASLLMRAELKRKHGLDIIPFYVKTHSSTYLHVAKHLTKAGGGVMRTLNEQKPSLQNKLSIIYTTTPVPAHPLVVHPRVDETTRTIIQTSWLSMAADNANVFNGVPMNAPIATSMVDYDPLRALGLADFVGDKE